jgi:hypothetical protein
MKLKDLQTTLPLSRELSGSSSLDLPTNNRGDRIFSVSLKLRDEPRRLSAKRLMADADGRLIASIGMGRFGLERESDDV